MFLRLSEEDIPLNYRLYFPVHGKKCVKEMPKKPSVELEKPPSIQRTPSIETDITVEKRIEELEISKEEVESKKPLEEIEEWQKKTWEDEEEEFEDEEMRRWEYEEEEKEIETVVEETAVHDEEAEAAEEAAVLDEEEKIEEKTVTFGEEMETEEKATTLGEETEKKTAILDKEAEVDEKIDEEKQFEFADEEAEE